MEEQWISVKDRLPDELVGKDGIGYLFSNDVLTFDDGDYNIASYHYDINKWVDNAEGFYLKPTHWMPLPKIPQ